MFCDWVVINVHFNHRCNNYVSKFEALMPSETEEIIHLLEDDNVKVNALGHTKPVFLNRGNSMMCGLQG